MDAGKPYLVMRAVRGEEKTPYEPAEYEYGRLLPKRVMLLIAVICWMNGIKK